MPVENAEVTRLFRETADLLEIQDENAFRVRAYRNAARVVEELPESIAELSRQGVDRLDDLPGVGKDLAGKIQQIIETGTFPLLEELRRKAPAGAAELTRVPGIGPKKARALFEALGIKTLEELETAARERRIRTVPGFGARTEEKILRELQGRRPGEHRILRASAVAYGDALLDYLRGVDGVERAEIAGSYRRALETVGDLDVLVTCRAGCPVVDRFVSYPDAAETLLKGPTRASIRLRSGLQVDLRVLAASSFGAGLHYFTGSKAHNIAVRRIAQDRGLKINEYGVYKGKRRVAGRSEEEVFRTVGLPWIPPEIREDRSEIQAAQAGTLPRLVELADIRGDLQCHSTDSDGRDTVEAMARAAEARGYEYLAITDHTPAVRVTGGMDAAGFRRQMRRIDQLNKRLKKLTLLKGAEVDIHRDGSLDLPDDVLAALDVVLVSLHSSLNLSRAEQTRRVVRALEHPSVDVFAHPTARLIGRRRGADLDLDTVFRAAADHGVLLEINAQPDRLDLDDTACRAAVEHGVKLVISTDAHSTAELGAMRWGVDQARRGWVEPKHVANTRSLAQLRTLLHRGRR